MRARAGIGRISAICRDAGARCRWRHGPGVWCRCHQFLSTVLGTREACAFNRLGVLKQSCVSLRPAAT